MCGINSNTKCTSVWTMYIEDYSTIANANTLEENQQQALERMLEWLLVKKNWQNNKYTYVCRLTIMHIRVAQSVYASGFHIMWKQCHYHTVTFT